MVYSIKKSCILTLHLEFSTYLHACAHADVRKHQNLPPRTRKFYPIYPRAYQAVYTMREFFFTSNIFKCSISKYRLSKLFFRPLDKMSSYFKPRCQICCNKHFILAENNTISSIR